MLNHGYNLKDLMGYMTELAQDAEDSLEKLPELYSDWQKNAGFGGALWPCYEEFCDVEYRNIALMRQILTAEELVEYLKDIGRLHIIQKETTSTASEKSRHNQNKEEPANLAIQCGNKKIVAEVNVLDNPELPSELCVYMVDCEGAIVQDICIVRPHYHFDKKSYDFVVDDSFVDCLVWGDSDNEDYTDKFTISTELEE